MDSPTLFGGSAVKTLLLLLLCLTSGFFSGCDRNKPVPNVPEKKSSKPQDLIIGMWTWTGPLGGQVINITNDFRKDGIVYAVQGGVPFQAKYRFVNDSQIEYEILIPGMPGKQMQYSKIESITNDKLVVIDEQGVKREWTRP
jgi:hypothetical protein